MDPETWGITLLPVASFSLHSFAMGKSGLENHFKAEAKGVRI
jgi:hypothetical protein